MERKQIISRDPEVMNGALVFAGRAAKFWFPLVDRRGRGG